LYRSWINICLVLLKTPMKLKLFFAGLLALVIIGAPIDDLAVGDSRRLGIRYLGHLWAGRLIRQW